MSAWTKPPKGVDAVIAGCGPAGAMVGLLLARAGLNVVVLEKHADFLRDFRGDTIHPSTLETLAQLGLAERFLRLPHVEARRIVAHLDGAEALSVPIDRLPTPFPFIALVPQWDFLDFLTEEARRYPGFHLVMEAQVTDLLRSDGRDGRDGRIVGVRYRTPDGERDQPALLTIGADGRNSRTRDLAGLQVASLSPPMDVLWFRVPRLPDDPDQPSLRIAGGRVIVLFDRGEYWQCACVVRKDASPEVGEIREAVAALAPFLADRVDAITAEGLRRLTVRADRLRRWFAPGYLAIGDAAHAMSPVGGVGINMAIQDAVATANALWRPLQQGRLSLADLRRVQRRREVPIRLVQALQGLIHRRVLRPALAQDPAKDRATPRRALRIASLAGPSFARFVALGPFRPRVRSPEGRRERGRARR